MNLRTTLLLCSMNALVWVHPAASAPLPYDFSYVGESLASTESYGEQAKSSRGSGTFKITGQGSDALLLLTNPNPGKAVFSITPKLDDGAEYLFRAKVKSLDQLVIRIGALAMSYNDLGNWQTVTGLYRAAKTATPVDIQLQLQSLTAGSPASAEIKGLSLFRVQRPNNTIRRIFSGKTDLVKDGAPAATLVIPAESEAYKEMAEQIRQSIHAKAGVSIPIITDVEATQKDYPALKPEFKSRNLILLGRLGNNRAFWTPYNRFLTAVDGFYPGGNGYAVHTAANVFRSGNNHLIIGGTSEEGVRRGTAKFVEKIAAADGNTKNLQLPWLLDVDLQGECLTFFKKENAKWEEKPESALLPKSEPGYGTVVRWYSNAMGYYWTGWEPFKKRADQYLNQVISDKAYTHHYIGEFFVRTFDMLDESGVISPEQVREIDTIFAANFLDMMTVGDLSWMTTFAPPYSQIGLVNRHQIAPWMADYKFAEFLTDIHTPVGGMKDLAEFRRQEKERLFTNFVTHRNNPSLPGGLLDEVYEEVNANFFRFALEKDLYREFFGSGNADKALALERINPRTGQFAYPGGHRDSKLPLGIMASLTRDPEIHWLWKHLPEAGNPRGYFQSRYLGNVRRYNPDADTPIAKPASRNGIQFTPNPVDGAPLKADKENYYFVTVRSGFEPNDDYLAFNGSSQSAPSGAIAALVSQGTTWLGMGTGEGGRFSTNSASAIRTDQSESKAKFDDQSRCLWSADLPTGIALRFQQLLTNEIEWTRDFVQLSKGTFVFRDQFTARQDGTYLLAVAWHPPGSFSKDTFITREGKLQIDLAGDGFAATPAQGEESGRTSLRNQTLKQLAKGESVVSYSVLRTSTAHATRFPEVKLLNQEKLSLGTGEKATTLNWNIAALSGIKSDAKLVIQTPDEIGFYDCSRLAIDSHPILEAGERTSFVASAYPDAGKLNIRTVVQQSDSTTERKTAASPDLQIEIKDACNQWKADWSYNGFLRPAKVADVRVLDDGTIDLGTTIDLAEIRGRSTTNYYSQGKLPEEILVSITNQPNNPETWKPAIGKRTWRPGIRTANYGEAHPEAEVDEALLLDGVKARYIKTSTATPLLFFTHQIKEARHPVRVEAGDFLNNGKEQTLVISDVFPQFPRPIRNDDLSVALLDENGKPIFQKELVGPIQNIRTLDRNGDGRRELFVLYGNGTLEIYGFDGALRASADLYKMHQEFAATHGKIKTRAPAGGYVLPFSVGLWRPNASGQSKIVVTRYGGFTFLNPDLTFEGVLSTSGYATPGILPHGVDFGSGSQEQVIAERLRVWQIGGSGTPTVRDPGSAQFWPQTYQLLKSIPENESSRVPLGGMPIVRFELLNSVTQQPRYVLLARGTSLSLYDAKTKTMQYSWSAQAPITGVGIIKQALGELQLVVATSDSLLWNFHWNQGIEREPMLSAKTFPDAITSIRDDSGSLIVTGANGVYRLRDGVAERIAEGAFQSAAPATGARKPSIVATRQNGEVTRFAPLQ